MAIVKRILSAWCIFAWVAAFAQPAVKAQYVRLEKNGKYLAVAEVLVYSEKANIAKNATATQSSVGYGGSPERAVDGDTDGKYSGKSVTHTADGDTAPWLEIDLGSEMMVDEIEIWNRTDVNSAFMNGVKVTLLSADRTVLCGTDLADVMPSVRYVAGHGTMTKKVKVVNMLSNEEAQKGKQWPDLRGLRIQFDGPNEGNKIFKDLVTWNVNVVRVNYFNVDKGSPWDVKGTPPPVPDNDPMAPYRKSITDFKLLMDLAEEHRIYVVLTLHSIVGRGYDDTVAKRTVEEGDAGQERVQEKLWDQYVKGIGDVWEYVAKNYGSNPWLIGYDLLNEPHTVKEVKYWSQKVVPGLVERIRAIDKDTWLVVEPGPWGGAGGFSTMPLVDDPKVIYSFHTYSPHSYCHQGVAGYPNHTATYPGSNAMWGPTDPKPPLYWDKEALRKDMQPAIDFAAKHKVRMLVGEFGVIRWASGGAKWLSDNIELFEEYGWDWTFHGYGYMWNGWDPALEANDPWGNVPGDKMTDRMKVLVEAWKKNKKQ